MRREVWRRTWRGRKTLMRVYEYTEVLTLVGGYTKILM